MKRGRRNNGCWSRLPADILQTIAEKLLANIPDYVRLGAVCTSWRSATAAFCNIEAPPPQLPWLMLSPQKHCDARSFFRFSDGKVVTFDLPQTQSARIVGSTDGWLVVVDASCNVRLLDPLTMAEIRLPPLSSLPQLEAYPDSYLIETDVWRSFYESDAVQDGFVRKIILLFPPAQGHELIAAAVLPMIRRLAFARPGDEEWTLVDQPIRCTDILWYRGQLYAVDKYGAVSVVVGHPAKLTPISAAIRRRRPSWWYLVESSGDILVVNRITEVDARKTEGFQVFKLELHLLSEEGMAATTRVESLGERMLFLGSNCSLSFSAAADSPGRGGGGGWKPNRIYFTTSDYSVSKSGKPEGDIAGMGIFDIGDSKLMPLPYHSFSSRFIWPPPIWYTPRYVYSEHRAAAAEDRRRRHRRRP